jgi:hypothetical protein
MAWRRRFPLAAATDDLGIAEELMVKRGAEEAQSRGESLIAS